jgi:bifunctional DNase/RNase
MIMSKPSESDDRVIIEFSPAVAMWIKSLEISRTRPIAHALNSRVQSPAALQVESRESFLDLEDEVYPGKL